MVAITADSNEFGAINMLDGTRKALLEGKPALQLWPYSWPTLLMGPVAILVNLWISGRPGRYTKRIGKLHRYG